MTQIWLVRHAQSKSQTGEDNDGRNPELSDLGRQQAQRLIEPLKVLEPDLVLLSPLQRAWQTYQLSQVNAPQIEFDSRLAESNWGIPDYYQPILPLQLPDIASSDRYHVLLTPVEERAVALMHDLVDHYEKRILLFGHWGIFFYLFQVFVGISVGRDSVRAKMDNTGISLFEVDDTGKRFIRFWNDRAHVRDLLE
jgi:broad specificity phosphatase PhoE